jgi:hypothetical protein
MALVEPSPKPSLRRVATAVVFVFGVVVGVIGLGITLDPCTHSAAVACGTSGQREFRAVMGYVGLALGGSSALVTVLGHRRLASAAAAVGGAACVAAIAEGVSHWGS